MDDDVREDIERREKELRGWMARTPSTRNTRRTIALAAALYDILLPHPREEFMDVWTTLHEFAWNHYDMADAAKAIFDARELTDDEYRPAPKLRPTFGGGYELCENKSVRSGEHIQDSGKRGGVPGPGRIPPF